VLFFYPFDFTSVCPTEIIGFNDAYSIFQDNKCEIIGCSTDSHFVHKKWSEISQSDGGIGQLNFPLLADIDKKLSIDYGVLIDQGENKGVSLRGTFIIDDKQIIRHISMNDLSVARNIDEVIRLVQAFQFSDAHG